MDVQKLAELAITSGLSGATSFLGAFLRFKQRLAEAETAAAAAKAKAEAAIAKADQLEAALNSLGAGWRLEFNNFKQDYERDVQHRDQLARVREENRQSTVGGEDFKRELEKLTAALEKVKEKQGRFVQNATFTEHVRSQEQQWKEIAKTLGRLEALVERDAD